MKRSDLGLADAVNRVSVAAARLADAVKGADIPAESQREMVDVLKQLAASIDDAAGVLESRA